MQTLLVSPMERAILQRLHDLYGKNGFPTPSNLSVVSRQNTGVGRYVDLMSEAEVLLPDGYYDLGGSFIALPAVPYGMMAVACVEGRKLRQIEIAVYGEANWDGTESGWSIV